MKTYAQYLEGIFGPGKVQKISINTSRGCPNRDGTLGYGGCIYCCNEAFSPKYCHSGASPQQQLQQGKEFFSRKYPSIRYLPYLQNYTPTAIEVEQLNRECEMLLNDPDTVGMVIGTRPDSLSPQAIRMLSQLPKPVLIELGAETCHNHTLKLINRGHEWRAVQHTATAVAEAGLHCGLHLIAGLPTETDESVLQSVDAACRLPIHSLKIHHLQVLKGTLLAQMIQQHKIKIPQYTLEHYLELCIEIIRRVPEHIVIERLLAQAPPEMVIMPKWGIKNYEFMQKLHSLIAGKTK